MAMLDRHERNEAAAALKERSPSIGCQVPGCPMVGTISPSIAGRGPWYCRFHFKADPRDYDAITLQLRKGTLQAREAKAIEQYRLDMRHGLQKAKPE